MSCAGVLVQSGLENLQMGAVGTTSPLENMHPALCYC